MIGPFTRGQVMYEAFWAPWSVQNEWNDEFAGGRAAWERSALAAHEGPEAAFKTLFRLTHEDFICSLMQFQLEGFRVHWERACTVMGWVPEPTRD